MRTTSSVADLPSSWPAGLITFCAGCRALRHRIPLREWNPAKLEFLARLAVAERSRKNGLLRGLLAEIQTHFEHRERLAAGREQRS